MKNYRNLGQRNLIGPSVRKFRNELALSQSALAATLQRKGWNVSRDAIASIESQTRRVSDFELILLAQVFKMTVQELLPKSGLEAKALEFATRLERVGSN